jgi:hypothetical protein
MWVLYPFKMIFAPVMVTRPDASMVMLPLTFKVWLALTFRSGPWPRG